MQIKSLCCDSTTINGGDPTGTIVSASQPIFVTSGAANSLIDSNMSADHVTEALPSIDELGTKYVIIPTTDGDYVKIVGKRPAKRRVCNIPSTNLSY